MRRRGRRGGLPRAPQWIPLDGNGPRPRGTHRDRRGDDMAGL